MGRNGLIDKCILIAHFTTKHFKCPSTLYGNFTSEVGLIFALLAYASLLAGKVLYLYKTDMRCLYPVKNLGFMLVQIYLSYYQIFLQCRQAFSHSGMGMHIILLHPPNIY